MSDPSDEGREVDADVPDAVMEWLSSVASERGMSEAELVGELLASGDSTPGTAGSGVDQADLQRVKHEFRELVEDVRDRVVQVKRETDEKAPAEHSHHELRSTVEQLGREIGSLEAEIERLDERIDDGFENYEEILTYLTDTTDSLDRKLGRLAGAVMDLRGQVGDAAREEVRRTALGQLTETANRRGIRKAKCEECGDGVHLGMLVEPRCPHCDTSFTSLEPKSGFFRSSVLHTGTLPALEAGTEDAETTTDALESIAGRGSGSGTDPPTFGETESRTGDTDGTQDDHEWERSGTAGPGGRSDLAAIDGIGPTYGDRLAEAGVEGLDDLATADPAELAEAIDAPQATVESWIDEASAASER